MQKQHIYQPQGRLGMHDSLSIARYLGVDIKQLLMLDIHTAIHGFGLRPAGVVVANHLPRAHLATSLWLTPTQLLDRLGPSQQVAADIHPQLLLCLLLVLLLVHRLEQHMQCLNHASSSLGACASILCAVV